MGLTLKQKRFADEYIISGNATDAARKAGYKKPDPQGSENLGKPRIREYIDARLAQKEDEAIAKQDEVLKYLTSVMRGKETEEVLKGTGKGAQVVAEVEVSAKDRIKAAELLGKRYALFTDRQELEADLNLNVSVDYGPDTSG